MLLLDCRAASLLAMTASTGNGCMMVEADECQGEPGDKYR